MGKMYWGSGTAVVVAQWVKRRVALHYTACSQGVSSNPLADFFLAIIKWVTMVFIPSEEIPK